MSWAGRVLSQPPISTTESIGWARIISSVSIDMRLRRNMLVGCEKLSWIETVGKTMGSAPASMTPRFTASIRSGHVAMAGIVVAEGVGDADDRPIERVIGVAAGLDEGLAQEQREAGIAIVGEALTQPGGVGGARDASLAGSHVDFSP